VGFEGALNEKRKGEEDASSGIHPLIKVFSLGEEVCYGVIVSGYMLEMVVKIL